TRLLRITARVHRRLRHERLGVRLDRGGRRRCGRAGGGTRGRAARGVRGNRWLVRLTVVGGRGEQPDRQCHQSGEGDGADGRGDLPLPRPIVVLVLFVEGGFGWDVSASVVAGGVVVVVVAGDDRGGDIPPETP